MATSTQPGLLRRMVTMFVLAQTRIIEAAWMLFLLVSPLVVALWLLSGSSAVLLAGIAVTGWAVVLGGGAARNIYETGYQLERNQSGELVSLDIWHLVSLAIHANLTIALGAGAGLYTLTVAPSYAAFVAAATPMVTYWLGEKAWYLSPTVAPIELASRLVSGRKTLTDALHSPLVTGFDVRTLLTPPQKRRN